MSDTASQVETIPLEMDRLRAVLARPLPPLDAERLLLAEGAGRSNALLRAYVAKVYVKRFFLAASKAFPLLPQEPELRRCVRDGVVAFQRLSAEALSEAILQPELTSWAWLVSEALESGAPPRLGALARHLGGFLLPFLWREGALQPDEALWLTPSSPNALYLLPFRRQLVSESPLPAHLRARVKEGRLSLSGEGLAALEVPLEQLLAPGTHELRPGLSLRDLTTTRDGAVLVLRGEAWYEEFFPRDGRGRTSPLHLAIGPEEFERFRRCMSEGTELIHEFWPEAWEEFREGISLLLPLHWQGMDPHNASVHAYRGLITSSARPSYLAAQTLLHETGHNKFSSLLDVYKLYENPEEEQYYSPFVDTQRPFSAILHGLFSFLQDIHITLRMRDKVPQLDNLSMERYLVKIGTRLRTALDTVHAKARLTEQGQALVRAMDRAMPR